MRNARICEVYECNSIFLLEPPLDLHDSQNFAEVMNNLMKPQCDSFWILCGRHEASYTAIMEVVKAKTWGSKMWYLNYDARIMEKSYWKKCRGLANSHSVQRLIFCWKGRVPTNMPNERFYVDAGSRLYVDVVNKVPTSSPKELAWVDKSVRDASLKRLGAGPSAS